MYENETQEEKASRIASKLGVDYVIVLAMIKAGKTLADIRDRFAK